MAAGGDNKITRIIRGFEYVVILTLMGLLMLVVAVSTVELAWMLLRDLSSIGVLLLDTHEMFDLFGFFLIILIGIELVTSLKSFLRFGAVQVEVVLEVALIAVAQKLIILDISRAGGLTLFGLAALVLALSVAFWLMRAAHQRRKAPPVDTEDGH